MLVLSATPAAGVATAGITWLAAHRLRLAVDAAGAAVVLLLLTAASILGAAS